MSQFITKDNLLVWLKGLMETHNLVAPQAVSGMVLFEPVKDVKDITFDYTNTALSPKEVVFPATSTLFRIERKDGQTELVPAVIEKETVLFGVRPCDAKGLKITDMPYYNNPTDVFYAQRRAKLALVGVACTKAGPACFCTTFGIAPQDAADMDVMLTPVDNGYVVNAVTDKGKELLRKASLSETGKTPEPPVLPEPIPIKELLPAMRHTFHGKYWSRVADRCIHCNTCAYVCPTCYCFDIRDFDDKGRVERIRTWDSCQAPGFTKMVSGVDPRADKGIRMRQRFAHKLLYFPQEFGPVACVGCGRCVVKCPVNIDIREIIRDVQRLAQEAPVASQEGKH